MAVTIVTSPKEFAKLFAEREGVRIERMKGAVIEAAAVGTRIIRSVEPVDRGGLRRSTRLEVHEETLQPGASGLLAEIIEDTPYAAAQEVGTRPFTPPFKPIFEWAKRQAPNLGFDRNDLAAIELFARGVWNKIRFYGITAKFHTRAALPKLVAVLAERVARAQRVPAEAAKRGGAAVGRILADAAE